MKATHHVALHVRAATTEALSKQQRTNTIPTSVMYALHLKRTVNNSISDCC